MKKKTSVYGLNKYLENHNATHFVLNSSNQEARSKVKYDLVFDTIKTFGDMNVVVLQAGKNMMIFDGVNEVFINSESLESATIFRLDMELNNSYTILAW